MKRTPLKRKTPLRSAPSVMKRNPLRKRSKKNKRSRLRGKALHELYDAAYERDGGQCINCNRYVPQGAPMHHEKPRSQGGLDRLEDVCVLCLDCHTVRHHKSGGQVIAQKCLDYLYGLYPETK